MDGWSVAVSGVVCCATRDVAGFPANDWLCIDACCFRGIMIMINQGEFEKEFSFGDCKVAPYEEYHD